MTRHAAAINSMNGTPQAVFLWMFTALVRNDPQEQDSRHAVIRNQQVSGSSPLAGSNVYRQKRDPTVGGKAV